MKGIKTTLRLTLLSTASAVSRRQNIPCINLVLSLLLRKMWTGPQQAATVLGPNVVAVRNREGSQANHAATRGQHNDS